MKHFLVFLIAAGSLMWLSCQKTELENIRIQGKVLDSVSLDGLEGVSLTLQSTSVSGGVYHGDYQTIASVTSNAFGDYEFNIETAKAVAYRILLEAPNYFGITRDFDPIELNKPEAANVDFDLSPMSWINLRVNNTAPYDNNDLISFNLNGQFNACSSCCGSSITKGEGPLYSYEGMCAAPGGQSMQVKWSVTKKGNTKLYQDSLQLTSFDTLIYQINY